MTIEDQPHRKVYELVSIGELVEGRCRKGSLEDSKGYSLRRKGADKGLQLLGGPHLSKNKGHGLHRGRHVGQCVLSENTIFLFSTVFLRYKFLAQITSLKVHG